MVSIIHCASVLLQYLINSSDINTNISIGFFVYDLFNSRILSMYFLHHLGSIYLLSSEFGIDKSICMYSFFILELSNIPLYFAYAIIHHTSNFGKKNIRCWIIIEMISFLIFRVVIFSYQMFLLSSHCLKLTGVVLQLFGWVWFAGLYKQLSNV